MERTVAQINSLVGKIRLGTHPVPTNKFEEIHWDRTLPGFGIRIVHTGGASWVVYYKLNGRQKRVTIGDARVLDRLDRDVEGGKRIPGALRMARDLLAKVQLDRLDPQQAKDDARRMAKITFKKVAELFIADAKVRPGTLGQYKRFLLEGYYFGPLHNTPLDEITGRQINERLKVIAQQSGKPTAESTCSPLKGMFRWAIREELFAGPSPMAQVKQPEKTAARTRVLEDDEIRAIWKTCLDWEAEVLADDERVANGLRPTHAGKPSSADLARSIRLLFLTACRAQEIGDLQWQEIKWKEGELHIPAERIKTETPLYLPLTDSALTILKSCQHKRPDYVFGRVGNEGRKGTGNGAGVDLSGANGKINRRIAEALGKVSLDAAKEQEVRELLAAGVKTWRIRRQAHVQWRRVKQIQAKIAAEQAGTAIAAPAFPEWFKPIPKWTVHDIRRTVRTRMAALGINRDICERTLNHVGHITSQQAAYDYYEYRVEIRQALQRWEDKLNAILGIGQEKIKSFGAARREKTA